MTSDGTRPRSSIVHDTPQSGGYRHVVGDEPPSRAVLDAVAAETGRSVLDLRPLYDVLDPDALDGLLGDAASGVVAEFDYAGCEVVVDSDAVHVREHDDAR